MREKPDYCAQLAQVLQGERERFGARGSLSQGLARLSAEVGQPDELPHTLLAISQDQLLGAATLTVFGRQLAPINAVWLTNVWVAPASRGRGLGTSLCQAQVGRAHQLGLKALWLYTHETVSFYRRMGWQLQRQTTLSGRQCHIMNYVFDGLS